MKRLISSLIIASCLLCVPVATGVMTSPSSMVMGQESSPVPEVVIDAPDSVKVGDIIVIDLSKSTGSGFDIQVIPDLPSAHTFDDGKVIVSGTGYKSQEFLVIVSCALDNKSDLETHVIKVKGPEPVVPDSPGKDIAKKVLSWCEGIESPTPRDDALKLGQSFASIAAMIETDAFQSPGEIIAATKTSNKDAVGDNEQYWLPLFQGLLTELKAMAAANMLNDVRAHGPVWRAVSEGLKEYANKLTG